VSNCEHLSGRNQGAGRQQLQRLGRMFFVIFLGALIAGFVAMLAFSASGCFLSHTIRCFSISRDLIGFSWFALKGLSLPAFVAALLVIMILQVRGFVVWWNVLVASFISALVTGLIDRVPVDPAELFLLLVFGLILFAGAQASLLINNRLGTLST
jgi:hypothetical protein